MNFRKINKGISVHQFFITALLLGNLVGGVCALGFLFWQLALVFTGTTTHELKNGLPAHSICANSVRESSKSISTKSANELQSENSNGIWVNVRDIFGPYWFITLILPIPMPQDGQGLYKKVFHLFDDGNYKN